MKSKNNFSLRGYCLLDSEDLSAYMNEAHILAGREKSVSARHYAVYELDRLTDTYIQCWERSGVSYNN
jgi:hypothetical protein